MIVYISDVWNVEIFILKHIQYNKKPKLIHFTANYKPWKNSAPDSNSFMYSDIYWEYAKKTANYDEIKNFKP